MSAASRTDRLWPILLGAATLVLGAVLLRYSLRLWTHNFDEDIYKGAGLATTHDLPWSLLHVGGSDRGFARLESWAFALGLGLFDSPDGFRAVRVINVIAYCSTVVPCYLWLRRLEVPGPGAALAAFLAVLVPWAAVTDTFLTENFAYPLATWALFAIWRAAERPRPGALILAVAAVLAAMLARSVMVLLFAVLAVAVAGTFLRCRAPAVWRGRGSWRRADVIRWAAVAVVAVAVVVALLADRSLLDAVTGRYSTGLLINWDVAGAVSRASLARVIAGVGIVPGILAIGWLGPALWRAPRPGAVALATLTIAMAAFAAYSALRGGPDERYLMYLVPPVLACAAVAVTRREIGMIAGFAATAAVVALFLSVPWDANKQAYGFLVSSAEAFYARILVLNLGRRAAVAGISAEHAVVAGVLVAGLVVVAALARRRLVPALLVVALPALVVVQVAQTLYVQRHFTTEAAFGPPRLEDRAWVDRASGGQDVALVAPRAPGNAEVLENWREVSFWNLSVKRVVVPVGAGSLSVADGPSTPIEVDSRTGVLRARPRLPQRLIEAQTGVSAPIVGRVVATGGYEPFALVRPDPPARLAWVVSGDDDATGWSKPGAPVSIRVFAQRGAARIACLDVALSAPPTLRGRREVRLRSGNDRRTMRLAADAPRSFGRVRLDYRGSFAEVRLQPVGTTPMPDGSRAGARIAGIGPRRC